MLIKRSASHKGAADLRNGMVNVAAEPQIRRAHEVQSNSRATVAWRGPVRIVVFRTVLKCAHLPH